MGETEFRIPRACAVSCGFRTYRNGLNVRYAGMGACLGQET